MRGKTKKAGNFLPAFRFHSKISHLSVLILWVYSYLINIENEHPVYIAGFGFHSLNSLVKAVISGFISHAGCPCMFRISPSLSTKTKIFALILHFSHSQVHGYLPFFDQRYVNITPIDHSGTLTPNNISSRFLCAVQFTRFFATFYLWPFQYLKNDFIN